MTNVKTLTEQLTAETEKIIRGKTEVIRLILTAVFADGHVLLNDLPGVGKTTLVKTLSAALGLDHRRLQFVSDMLPADITGMTVFNQKTCDFEFREGPVMTNILLADEINRAVPRTQSALLEAMEERQISIDGVIHRLPDPFLVLATQNPVESESTFRLPAAQMDRFLLCTGMGYPDAESEMEMLKTVGDAIPLESVQAVTCREGIAEARKEIAAVHTSDQVLRYIVAIAEATRTDSRLRLGISPRGTRAMYRAAKARAAMEGREFVIPDDIKALAQPVFEHRLLAAGGSGFSGGNAGTVLEDILSEVSVPEI